MLHIVKNIIAGVLVVSVILVSTVTAAKKTKMSQSSFLSEKNMCDLLKFDDAIANSFSNFSGSQGASGWNYGYVRTDTQSAKDDTIGRFDLMETYKNSWWRNRNSNFTGISASAFNASPGFSPVRRWTPQRKGSVRIVGYIQKVPSETKAEFRVLVAGKVIWSLKLSAEDTILHGYDILAYDLTEKTPVDFMVIAGSGQVQVKAAFEIVPEPYTSRWSAELPDGYPKWSEQQRQQLRQKGQDILEQIRQASAAEKKRIVIPPGDYLFNADRCKQSTLKNLADIEIVADGVTFWFEPPMMGGLLFENCNNVTVRGLNIDFTIATWFQARLTDIDRKNKTICATLTKGYEPRDAYGKAETSGDRSALMFYNPDGSFINHRHTPASWKLTADGTGVICKPGRYGIPDALEVGDYLVGTLRSGAALQSKLCAGMRYEDVNIWSSAGAAVYEGGGKGGNIYKRMHTTRRPHTNRLHAFGSDIFHLAGADHGPTLDSCELAYGADDTLNIHGHFGRVVKRVNDKSYYLQGAYETGDKLEFRDSNSLELLGIAKVLSAKETPDGPSLAINETYTAKGQFLLEFDKPLELAPLSLVVMDGKQSAEGFVVRNCWIHSDFQRALINGSPGGLIENNTLQNVGYGICIQFETWGPWMEGPFARDLVVRNNRFFNCSPHKKIVGNHDAGEGCISVAMYPKSNRKQWDAKPVYNLQITGNYFDQASGLPMRIRNVDGLKIQGNSIDWSSQSTTKTNWISIEDCNNVSISDNQLNRKDYPKNQLSKNNSTEADK